MTSSKGVALTSKFQANTLFDAESMKRHARRQFVFWLLMGMAALLSVHSYMRNKNSDVALPMRKLLSSSDCTSHPEWIEKGGVALHFVGICYLFIGIYIVCEDYFVKSLDEISARLNLSKDVAGAIFMAAGSSAPELFTSLVALTNDHASNEIGVGTIVGSAVFNILVIIGVSAVFSGGTLNLDYRPLVRDCLFYATAIIGVVAVFYDGKIYWWEGLIFVMLYGVYILAMKFNKTILNLFPEPATKYVVCLLFEMISDAVLLDVSFERFNASDVDLENLPCEPAETFSSDEEIYHIREVNSNEAPLLPKTNGDTLNMSKTTTEQQGQNGKANSDNVVECTQTREDDKSPFSVPKGKLDKLYWMVLLLWRVSFHHTIPDCTKRNLKEWYMVTFVLSIVWIGGISWFMVGWATDIGIPSAIMGVTVLAAGTSIPDAISSVDVARRGEGDMAVANAVGSNVFDILLGLGLPWLCVIPFIGEPDSYGKYIEVDSDELLLSVGILFGVLVFYVVCIICSGWRIDKRHGYVFISLYLVYALYYITVQWAYDI